MEKGFSVKAAVTILAIVIGLFFVIAVYTRSARHNHTDLPTPRDVSTEDTSAKTDHASHTQTPATKQAVVSPDIEQVAQAPAVATDAKPASTQTTLVTHATSTTNPASTIQPLHTLSADAQASTLGSDAADSPYAMKVDFSAWGASISKITLAHYTQNAMSDLPYQTQGSVPVTGADGRSYSYYPFAARFITVNNQKIALDGIAWKKVGEAIYTTDLLLPDNTPALRLTRRYSLEPKKDDYQLLCQQTVENLTGQALSIVWEQSIQAEQPHDAGSYMGDQRRLYVGYYDNVYDRDHRYIVTDNGMVAHTEALKSWEKEKPFFWPVKDGKANYDMVWFAEANRYFFTVTYRPPVAESKDESSSTAVKIQPLQTLFPNLNLQVVMGQPPVLNQTQPNKDQPSKVKLVTPPEPIFIYSLASKPIQLAPNGQANLDLALFTGPRDPSLIAHEPYHALGFENLIRYQLSCSLCTFQWLAKLLLEFMRIIHAVLFDWGMAIIVLVLVVRLALHPITKKSQIAMTKMGKQMATLKPEMDKIKKKYADDQTRQNQEVMKLYKEKGINPAGMLGCLPMFLQTPIWIALYAMLYFAIELRHEPAFYGVFQAISGGHWAFLADLSSPDNFLHFSHSFKLNLIFVHPEFAGINVIPLLMAVFYYFQQAFIMPPAASEQQAQQQKIGKYMTVMVPIFLYSAPSGLTLYMLASSIGGMVDGWIVRRHINRMEKEGTLFAPKAPKETKPGGLMDRIQKAMAKQQEKLKKQQKPQQFKTRQKK